MSNISKLNEDIKNGLRKLEKTSLKPELFGEIEFYQQMIKTEEVEKEDGWTKRVMHLQEIKMSIKYLDQISNGKLEDLIPGYKELEAQVIQAKLIKSQITVKSGIKLIN